jgi:hypothetical protein
LVKTQELQMSRCNFFVMSAIAVMGMAALSGGANAQQATPNALCRPGSVVACTILGKPGTMKCLGDGEYGGCDLAPPAPVTGSVFAKYYVLTVVYAPPGTNGGKSTSQVTYESDSSTGTTTTNSSSFKQDYSVTATVGCAASAVCDIGLNSGGVSFEYTQNQTHTDSLDITKTNTSKLQVNGPATDGVNHANDEVWLLIHPKFDVTIQGSRVIWTLDADQSAGLLQFLYVQWLQNPSQIPGANGGLLADLNNAGFTAQDYQDILNAADPLAECQATTVGNKQAAITRLPPPAPVQCNFPAPSPPRYVTTNINLPYNPPLTAADPVPLQTEEIDNSTISKSTNSDESDTKVGITTTSGLSFAGILTASLKTDSNWTWTSENTTEADTGSTQKMTLALGGPAFGYNGPANMDVFYDTLYKTFVFVPDELSAESLHGVVLNSAGKPAAGELVTAMAAGTTYRTYTNADGVYHFSAKLTGPVTVLTGNAAALQLASLDLTKSYDFRLK